MKNLLGEEVTPQPLRFDWMAGQSGASIHLTVLRGKKMLCMVHPNGWNGYIYTIGQKLGEPLINHLDGGISFADVTLIMAEYFKKVTPREILHECICALAREKKLTFDDAVKYIKTHNIDCIPV